MDFLLNMNVYDIVFNTIKCIFSFIFSLVMLRVLIELPMILAKNVLDSNLTNLNEETCSFKNESIILESNDLRLTINAINNYKEKE